MKKKPLIRTTDFAESITSLMQEDQLIKKDEFDYISNCKSEVFPIADIEPWIIYGTLDFGGSEGIYLTMYMKGDFLPKSLGRREIDTPLTVFKTLDTSNDAFRRMGLVMADYILTAKKIMSENEEDFIRRGYNIVNDDNKAIIWCENLLRARKYHEKGYRVFDCYSQEYVSQEELSNAS